MADPVRRMRIFFYFLWLFFLVFLVWGQGALSVTTTPQHTPLRPASLTFFLSTLPAVLYKPVFDSFFLSFLTSSLLRTYCTAFVQWRAVLLLFTRGGPLMYTHRGGARRLQEREEGLSWVQMVAMVREPHHAISYKQQQTVEDSSAVGEPVAALGLQTKRPSPLIPPKVAAPLPLHGSHTLSSHTHGQSLKNTHTGCWHCSSCCSSGICCRALVTQSSYP